MGTIKTQAIVLRYADYRENDRMLTLLSPVHGRIDAIARGCKRPKSPLLAASEWFAQGEYMLYASGGHVMVTSCMLQESFYPIRQDYDRLEYATYLLSLCEAAAQPGQAALGLFKLITRSLFRLAYKD
ncbi:MAG: DNA repair protein RecO, partial [Clostridia bacterium]|nr:DNA repair protein RecO [Clostridia bacterium]